MDNAIILDHLKPEIKKAKAPSPPVRPRDLSAIGDYLQLDDVNNDTNDSSYCWDAVRSLSMWPSGVVDGSDGVDTGNGQWIISVPTRYFSVSERFMKITKLERIINNKLNKIPTNAKCNRINAYKDDCSMFYFNIILAVKQ